MPSYIGNGNLLHDSCYVICHSLYPVAYHVDGDAVPLLDALGLEDIGELADLLVQLRVRRLALVAQVVTLPEEGSLCGGGTVHI